MPLSTLAVIAVLSTTPLPAQSTITCLPWQEALAKVRASYGELPAFIARMNPSGVITFTVNEKTGTWTAWLQRTPETMCIISFGEGWIEAPPAVRDAVPDPQPQLWRFPDGWGGYRYLHPA